MAYGTGSNPPLGWIAPSQRTVEQSAANMVARRQMPRFALSGGYPKGPPPVGTKILLPDFWKHQQVTKALGQPYTGSHQETGSCVWAGAQNVVTTLQFIEAIRLGVPEQIVVPFVLLDYGISRLNAGMSGQGEGSMGGTMAQACREAGIPSNAFPGLPTPISTNDGWDWGSKAEMIWSDGGSIQQKYLDEAKNHLVKTTGQCRSADDVRTAILNYYPCTTAWNDYISHGTIKGSTAKAVVGDYDGSGGHQTSWLGYWNNPELGELFWYQNNWGLRQYPDDPGGGPLGGLWQPYKSVDMVCKSGDGEVYAFSQWLGYPVQQLDWALVA